MPTEVFEDSLDLRIGLIEATLPDWRKESERGSSYPYPLLTPISSQEMRRFGVFLLENPLLRATIVPALGGRLLGLFDKRTGKEVLPRGEAIQPAAGGLRGAVVREGLQFQYVSGQDRLNALGRVDATAEEGEDPGVWIAESAGGGPLGFHLYHEMPPERAEIVVEARVLNRTLKSAPYNGGFAICLPDSEVVSLENGVAAYSAERDSGIALFWDTPMTWRAEDGFLRASRFDSVGSMGPRQLDTIRLRIVPISGLGGLSGASPEAAVYIGGGFVRLQSVERRLNHKLLLVTRQGETLEAPTDVHPEAVVEVPLGDLDPQTVVLRDPAKNDVVRVDAASDVKRSVLPPVVNSEPTISAESSNEELFLATLDVSQRALAHTLLGMRALVARDFGEASEQFERALLFNAEDHLTWWLKATADRMRGVEGERPELLNAHYLAPLEPVLRAEAFLAQGAASKEPNPLVAPMAEIPENLVEVASLLLEAGLAAEASVWIDEALRHRDLPILHALQSYALSFSHMDVEAARHRSLAKGISEPPFPYRDVEWKALG
jgi:hypothetical protein